MVAGDSPVVGFNVVKGFLNLEFEPAYWSQWLHVRPQKGTTDRSLRAAHPRVMVEYSSPEHQQAPSPGPLAQQLSWAHLSAASLKLPDTAVTKVQIVNDRGIHICKSMVAWRKFGAR